MNNRVVGSCPKCDGYIIEFERGYSCENKETCDFHLNYHNLAGLGVPFVKKDIIKKLLKDPDGVVELKARESGNSYKKKAWLHKGEEYTAWTIVVADDFHNEYMGKCPLCSSAVLEFGKHYGCESESCNFKLWKTHYGVDIDETICQGLLSGKTYDVECTNPKDKKKHWEESIWIESGYLMREPL